MRLQHIQTGLLTGVKLKCARVTTLFSCYCVHRSFNGNCALNARALNVPMPMCHVLTEAAGSPTKMSKDLGGHHPACLR